MNDQKALRAAREKQNLARLGNVYLDVAVEVGRKEMTLQELRSIKKDSVIGLPKLAGEAFDILLNDRVFAEGEVVVVTDMMAVRVTRHIDCEVVA